MASYQQSVVLFARYQKAIHGDDPSECSETEVLHDYIYYVQLHTFADVTFCKVYFPIILITLWTKQRAMSLNHKLLQFLLVRNIKQ